MKKFVPTLALLSILAIGCQSESPPQTSSKEDSPSVIDKPDAAVPADTKTGESVTHTAAKPVSPEPLEKTSEEPKDHKVEPRPADSESVDSTTEEGKAEPNSGAPEENQST
ncbi:MAG: hypothetical protein R3C59_11875 [Planctomycetaceae bacterium]